jgi:hypothetical protein
VDADMRNRPVVLLAGPDDEQAARRRHRSRTFVGVTAAAIVATAGLAAGSWAVWSALGTNTPKGPPTPLWFSPPTPEQAVPLSTPSSSSSVAMATSTTAPPPAAAHGSAPSHQTTATTTEPPHPTTTTKTDKRGPSGHHGHG